MSTNGTSATDTISESEFKLKLADLLAGHPAKVWLARSAGHRLEVLFGVGEPQGLPVKNFDHLNGFYLMGEGVTPDLVAPLHNLFVWFCRGHRSSSQVHPVGHVQDPRVAQHPHVNYHGNRLTLHSPFSVGV